MPSISEPVLGVSRAMARYGWCGEGMWRGFMMERAFLCIAKMVPPEQRLVFLL
jgi:hypothetical protein